MRPGEHTEATSGTPAPSPGSGAVEADGIRVIPEAVRAAARQAPGHWIGVVDPEWTEERTPPEWAVLGEWRSDDDGDVGTYRANPAYRPSARALGWPEPTDPVDAAAQRAATGYGSVEEAVVALAAAEVTVVAGPDGIPLAAAGQDGEPVVLVFTSPAHAFMSPTLRHDTLPVRDLIRSLAHSPAISLLVNAGAVAPLLVPANRVPVDRGEDPAGSSRHTSGRYP
ncbi:type VII secretion system-associated protein [Streptomyces sp. Vc74B-19]|uniref:type VII secretion system-associated protein n=1 Tax=Streptomyces sp. Vc74B-19 TaxID=2741324 RepID=UPI001BFC241B|nr:type VII secretion system-associated protein [Streptomyces sp. Vc74B-19]MBT3162155.1 type VII secretion system-associated protein [Streptomyces sp. Vc74B-19]